MNRVTELQALMRLQAIDAYLIPRGDEFLGEFVAAYAERLAFVSGFTGSAGMAVVRADDAHCFSDGRYVLQMRDQLNPQDWRAVDSTKYAVEDWLYDHMQAGQVIGFDPALHSIESVQALEKRLETKGVTLKPIAENLIDLIWADQPARPDAPHIDFPEDIAGVSVEDKLKSVCEGLNDIDAYILTQPDSVCWLSNVRGSDVPYTPIALRAGIIDVKTGSLSLMKAAGELPDLAGKSVGLDFLRSPYAYMYALEKMGAQVRNLKDPCIVPRACKAPSEQEAMRQAHIVDGVAMVKWLAWFEANGIGYNEVELHEKLQDFRAGHPAYKGPSFPTIAGFGANGAVIHYRAQAESALTVGSDNLLLLDSGGQYLSRDFAGTTDITRTIATGAVSDDVKRANTLVLKGHVALSAAHFPPGTTGMQLDAIARQPLWNEGLDYAHGTGHGVGCYSAVHEEAASISSRGKDALEPSMILSNEPGYYKDGEYGIRIENLILVSPADAAGMLGFETLTLAPYDRSLIDADLLDREDIAWINAYHARVLETLSPYLEDTTKEWLQNACKPL